MITGKLFVGLLFLVVASLLVFAVPSATDVRVWPDYPRAGDDLYCNYSYSSPLSENYSEQTSYYEWWKNSSNQNINSQLLSRGNLSPSDYWYCKVTPSDGLNNGSAVQSANTVSVNSSVRNVQLLINNSLAWSVAGYYSATDEVSNFNSFLTDSLDNCIADSEGYCNITLNFTSDFPGLLNITDLDVVYAPKILSLNIASLSTIYANGTLKIFEFIIVNNGSESLNDVSWKFDVGDGSIINSTLNSSLDAGKNLSVYVEYNYSSDGEFTVRANASATYVGMQSITLNPYDLNIENLTILNVSGNKRIFGFDIRNYLSNDLTDVFWSFDTKDSLVINASNNITLDPDERALVFVEYDFTSPGTFNVNVTARNHSLTDWKNLSVTII